MKNKIAIGCDHAAFDEKEKLKTFLIDKGYELDEVGKMVVNNEVDKGIVICGSGIGISIAANKIKGIRAALCTSSKHAEMSRKHNDANVLALGARMTDFNLILEIVDVWLNTDFEGGRHLKRVNLIEI